VHVHHGTRESPARVAWLGGDFWQLRLEQPLMGMAGDRVVVRQIAPPDTLGGGVILDAHPKKHGPSRALLQKLGRLSAGEAVEDEPPEADGASPAEAEPPPLSAGALAAAERLRQAGVEPPLDSEFEAADLAALRAAGQAVRVGRTLHYDHQVLAEIRARVIALAERHGGAVTLAQVRDELGTSRKFAQALLEHFDSEKLTLRRDDQHVLRRFRSER
jgi:selenocysteine-specific elongation factor